MFTKILQTWLADYPTTLYRDNF